MQKLNVAAREYYQSLEDELTIPEKRSRAVYALTAIDNIMTMMGISMVEPKFELVPERKEGGAA